MKRKITFVLVLALAAFFVMGSASAGLFDFLGGGGDAVENQTYDFNECTLDIPSDATVVNKTVNEQGVLLETFVITYANGTPMLLETLSGGNIVPTIDDYKMNAAYLGAKYLEDHGKWAVFNTTNADLGDDSSQEYVDYVLAYHDGTHIYQIEGNDLDLLKSVADTFKAK